MKKLSVIIVNYNTENFLRECIDNLVGKYPNMEVIVVDNDSRDGSAEMVEKEFNWVKLIKSENKGLAHGSNLGLRAATGDYILYLGTDAYPQRNTLVGMVEYMENNPDVGAATCKLVLRDGSLDMDAHRGFPTPWAALTHFAKLNRIFPNSVLFNQYFLGAENLDIPHEIDLCIAHFMLLRKSVMQEIGNWDEDFFVYGEDVDYCYRIKQAGWKIMYLPQWQATHYKGVGVGVRRETRDITKASEETKKNMQKQTTHAMKLFYAKHYKDKYPFFITGFVLFGIFLLNKLRGKKG